MRTPNAGMRMWHGNLRLSNPMFTALLIITVAGQTMAGNVPAGGKCSANTDCLGADTLPNPSAFCMRVEPSLVNIFPLSKFPFATPQFNYCVSAVVTTGTQSSSWRYYGWLLGTGQSKSKGCDNNAYCPSDSTCLDIGGYSCVQRSPQPAATTMYYRGEFIGFTDRYGGLSVIWGRCPTGIATIADYGLFIRCGDAAPPRPCDVANGWVCTDPTTVCNSEGACVPSFVSCTDHTDCAEEPQLTYCDPIDAICKIPAAPGGACDQNVLIACADGSVCQPDNFCRLEVSFRETCGPPSVNYACTGADEACDNSGLAPSPTNVCLRIDGAFCEADADCLSGGCDANTTHTCRVPVVPGGVCGLSTLMCIGGGVCQPDNVCRIPHAFGGACDQEITITCADPTTECVSTTARCLYSLTEACGADVECATPRCASGTCKNEVAIGGDCTDASTTVCVVGADCRTNPLVGAGTFSCQVPRAIGDTCAAPAREYCVDYGSTCGTNNKVAPDQSAVCVLQFAAPCNASILTDGVCDNGENVCDDATSTCLRKIDATCRINSDCAQTYDFCAYGHRNCQQGENRPTACRDNGFGRKVCLDMPPWLGRWCDPRCPTDNDCKECRNNDTSVIDALTNCTAIGLKLAADQAAFEAGTASTRRLLQATTGEPPILLAALWDPCAHPRDCSTGLTCHYYNTTAAPGTLGDGPVCVTPDTIGAGCLDGWACTGGLVCAEPAPGAPWAPCVSPHVVDVPCNPLRGCGDGLSCNTTDARCERIVATPPCPDPVVCPDGAGSCPTPAPCPPALTAGAPCPGGTTDCEGGLICLPGSNTCGAYFVPVPLGGACTGGDDSLCEGGLVCHDQTCKSGVGGACGGDGDCQSGWCGNLDFSGDPPFWGTCVLIPLGQYGCTDGAQCQGGLCRPLIYDESVPPPPGVTMAPEQLEPVGGWPAESVRLYCLAPYVPLAPGAACFGDTECGTLVCAGLPVAGENGNYGTATQCRPAIIPVPLLWNCTTHDDCEGGLVCDTDANPRICVGAKTYLTCNTTTDCATGFCDTTTGRCAGRPAGTYCDLAEECAGTLVCVGNHCQQPLNVTDLCGPSVPDAHCGPGLSCGVAVGEVSTASLRCLAPKGAPCPVAGLAYDRCASGHCSSTLEVPATFRAVLGSDGIYSVVVVPAIPEGPLLCTALPKGQPCTESEECAGDLMCVADTCTQYLPLRSPCGAATDDNHTICGLGLTCHEARAGNSFQLTGHVCLWAKGAPCTGFGDTHCTTGMCDQQTFVCVSFPVGHTCAVSEDCAGALTCEGGFCAEPLPLGAPCGAARLAESALAICGPGLSCGVPVGAVAPNNVAPRCVAPKGASPGGCSTANCSTGYCSPAVPEVSSNVVVGGVVTTVTTDGVPATCVAFPRGHICAHTEDCAGALACLGVPGVCKEALEVGVSCGTAGEPHTYCGPGMICSPPLVPVGGDTAPRCLLAPGEDCTEDAHCHTNNCNAPTNGACTSFAKGRECTLTVQCAGDLVCRAPLGDEAGGGATPLLCLPIYVPKAHGIACTVAGNDYECGAPASGLICNGMPLDGGAEMGPPICRTQVVPFPRGWGCPNGNNDCAGGLVCDTDAAQPVCVGAKTYVTCTADTQCAAGFCNTTAGYCAARPDGYLCDVSENCAGDLVCAPDPATATATAPPSGEKRCRAIFAITARNMSCAEDYMCGAPVTGLVCGGLPLNGGSALGPPVCRAPVVPFPRGWVCPNGNSDCAGGLVCDADTHVCVGAKTYVVCSADTQCATGYCDLTDTQNGHCAARPRGYDCADSEDCAGTLICHALKCAVALPAGATCPEPDAYCGLGLLCGKPLGIFPAAATTTCLAPKGAPCTGPDTCATGYCGAGGVCANFPATHACAESEDCAGSLVCGPNPATATALAPASGALTCRAAFVATGIDDDCDGPVGDRDYVCGAPASGLICAGLPLAGGTTNITRVCRPPVVPLPAGWTCTVATDCLGGLVCEGDRDVSGDVSADAELTCRTPYVPSPLGAVCVVSDTCAGGHSCVYGRCTACAHASLDEGSACTKNDDCVFGTYCPNTTCVAVPVPLADGSVCMEDNDCDGRICKRGVCQSPKHVGDSCDEGGECKGGLVCLATICSITPLPLPLYAPCNVTGAPCEKGLECDNGIEGDLYNTQAPAHCRLLSLVPQCHTCQDCPFDDMGGARGALRKERQKGKDGSDGNRRLLTHGAAAPTYHAYMGYDLNDGDWDDITGLIHDWKAQAAACQHAVEQQPVFLPPPPSTVPAGPATAGVIRSGRQSDGTASVLVGIAILVALIGCIFVVPPIVRSVLPGRGRGRKY